MQSLVVLIIGGASVLHWGVTAKRPASYLEPPVNSDHHFAPSLPEIIINRNVPSVNNSVSDGYYYKPHETHPLYPYPPNKYIPVKTNNTDVQFDPLIPVSDPYLPPPVTNFEHPKEVYINFDKKPNIPETSRPFGGYVYERPTTTQRPPLSDDIPEPPNAYLPSSYITSNKEVHAKSNEHKEPIRVEITSMSCLQASDSYTGYFSAVITTINSIENCPVIDATSGDINCELMQDINSFRTNITQSNFDSCGVYECAGNELCLRLRFPQVFGMRMLGDASLTLQCKPQQKVNSHTHTISTGIHDAITGRSLGKVATGGSQLPFRSQVVLYRKSLNGYASVSPGDTVALGEDLLLKANVRQGDGWQHCRLTDVTMYRTEPDGSVTKAVPLLGPGGCPGPEVRAICPSPPRSDSALGLTLGLKAVMFRGMDSGQEMALRVTIEGCLDKQDCIQDTSNCSGGVARERRSASEQGGVSYRTAYRTNLVTYRVKWSGNRGKNETHIQKKVPALTTNYNRNNVAQATNNGFHIGIGIVVGVSVAACLTGVLLGGVVYWKKNTLNY